MRKCHRHSSGAKFGLRCTAMPHMLLAIAMHARAEKLIEVLKLEPHPEGGFFREVFRSPETVKPNDARTDRTALTAIYFLLVAGQRSLFHRVVSDEIWHFYEGDPLRLICLPFSLDNCTAMQIGGQEDGSARIQVIPAGYWQAAQPLGEYTLVGCTVAPGFEFSDFKLLRDCPEKAALLRERFPDLAEFI